MDLYWLIIIVAIVAGLIVWLFHRRHNTETDRLTAQLEAATEKLADLQEEQKEAIRIRTELETRLQATTSELERERKRSGQISEEMQALFKATASEILEDKTRKLSGMNEERIGEILKPLSERIKLFEEKVEKSYNEEARERFSLAKELQKLIEQNSRLSDDANNLTRALKGDPKVQGDWGEMILENLLRRSGLTEGEEFFIQETLTDDEGRTLLHDETGRRMRPDVIVRYPNGQEVIIDSKVSLTAYASFVASEDEAERKRLLGGAHRQHQPAYRGTGKQKLSGLLRQSSRICNALHPERTGLYAGSARKTHLMGSGLQQTRAAHESDQPDRSFADGSGSMAARPASEKCAANRRASQRAVR